MPLASVLNPKLTQDVVISRVEGVSRAQTVSISAPMVEPACKFLVLALTSIEYSRNATPATLDIN